MNTIYKSVLRGVLAAGAMLTAASVFAGSVTIEAVKATPRGAEQYNFSVTLKHDDTGWDHYANAWDVVDLQGNVLGTRTLHHPHVNEQPFTRSQLIQVPVGTGTVEVRAYDSVHGMSEQRYKVELSR